MQKVVIDTNILVSALWSENGNPARLMSLILSDMLVPCYDYRIMQEYREVLNRPRFSFTKANVNEILNKIKADGLSVTVPPVEDDFVDKSDKKFYEVAKYCQAVLITGNIKHYPPDDCVLLVADFLGAIRA